MANERLSDDVEKQWIKNPHSDKATTTIKNKTPQKPLEGSPKNIR